VPNETNAASIDSPDASFIKLFILVSSLNVFAVGACSGV
jgi:hypothetical protein